LTQSSIDHGTRVLRHPARQRLRTATAFPACYGPLWLSPPGKLGDPRTLLHVPPGCARDTTTRLTAHTQHATFTALRFPGRSPYARRADSWLPTGRRTSRTSRPSSAFLPSSVRSAFQRHPLADLHPVLLMTAGIRRRRRLRPLSRTRACARPLAGRSGMRVPQFQTKKF
jgi:hypothetical protein